MELHWGEIFGPQAGLAHLFWVLVFGVGLYLLRVAWVWLKNQNVSAWRREISLGLVGVGGVFLSFLALQTILNAAFQNAGLLQSKPNFRADVFGSIIADQNPRTHFLTINLRVFNSGAPSVIDGWNLRVKGADNQWIQALFLADQEKSDHVGTWTTGETNVQHNADSLVGKTRNPPNLLKRRVSPTQAVMSII